MRPIFSVHAGEYLVGTHIEEKYKDLNVWIPSKDTGIDLLVTDRTNTKTLSIQVKFSKDFLGSVGKGTSEAVATKVKSGGWWTFRQDKIKASPADLWILVLYRFTDRDYDFVIIEPQELLMRYAHLGRETNIIQSYVWVTTSGKCWETRGLNKSDQEAIAKDEYSESIRDLSSCLNNWQIVERKLL